MQLLTQELICARNHYQLKKSVLSRRWEHLSHSALLFRPGSVSSGTAPDWPSALWCMACSWLDRGGCSRTLLLPWKCSMILCQHWHKLTATHPDRATLNDKPGMFLKHFPERRTRSRISSEVNKTDYFSTRSQSTERTWVNCPNHPSSEHGGASRQWNTSLYQLLRKEDVPLSPTKTFCSYTVFYL